MAYFTAASILNKRRVICNFIKPIDHEKFNFRSVFHVLLKILWRFFKICQNIWELKSYGYQAVNNNNIFEFLQSSCMYVECEGNTTP